jgi:hypothetical protein
VKKYHPVPFCTTPATPAAVAIALHISLPRRGLSQANVRVQRRKRVWYHAGRSRASRPPESACVYRAAPLMNSWMTCPYWLNTAPARSCTGEDAQPRDALQSFDSVALPERVGESHRENRTNEAKVDENMIIIQTEEPIAVAANSDRHSALDKRERQPCGADRGSSANLCASSPRAADLSRLQARRALRRTEKLQPPRCPVPGRDGLSECIGSGQNGTRRVTVMFSNLPFAVCTFQFALLRGVSSPAKISRTS